MRGAAWLRACVSARCYALHRRADATVDVLVPRATNDKKFIRDAAMEALGHMTTSGCMDACGVALSELTASYPARRRCQ